MEQNACLKCFTTKYWECCKKVYAKRRFEMLMFCENAYSWRMGVTESVCHQLCRQTVALSTNGMHEIRGHFECQLWKHKLNNCGFAGLYVWIKHLQSRDMNACKAAICTSVHLCHVLIHYLHCCTGIKFTIQQLSLNSLCAFNLQLHGCTCDKFHSNMFRSVWDILWNKTDVFFWTHCIN